MTEHATRSDIGITLVLITTAAIAGILARALSLLVGAPACHGSLA